MSPKQLLEDFEGSAEARCGVQRLRRFIMDRGVRG
jgi:hypothetical protein